MSDLAKLNKVSLGLKKLRNLQLGKPTEHNITSGYNKGIAMLKEPFKLVLVLDNSGSMYNYKDAVMSNLSSYLIDQKKFEATAVTLYSFNDNVKKLYYETPITDVVNNLAFLNLKPNGNTALYAAVEMATKNIKNADMKTLVVICTDGEDNQSSKSMNSAREEVSRCQKLGVKFIVLAAGSKSAYEIATMLGINEDYSADFKRDETGFKRAFACILNATNSLRESGVVSPSWSQPALLPSGKKMIKRLKR